MNWHRDNITRTIRESRGFGPQPVKLSPDGELKAAGYGVQNQGGDFIRAKPTNIPRTLVLPPR